MAFFCVIYLCASFSRFVVKDAHPMQEKFMRLPLKMDAPEKVLSQAHGQARPIADFLHENGTSSFPT